MHRRLERSAERAPGASTLRPASESIVHGGDLDRARKEFPDAPEPWIDLSTGINPDAYPVAGVAPEAWTRLPQADEQEALLRGAAQCYGAASPQMVVAAPGTQALINLLPRLTPPARVAILGPTYAEHSASWRRTGHDVVEVHTLADAERAGIVVLVNPNNPTGLVVPRSKLLRLAATLEARGASLVVDEAFADVGPHEASLVPELPPNAIVLRSFGKTYGLAGLRLGFAIAHEALAQRLRDALGPWAVSGPAIAIGTRALADDAWREAALARLTASCHRLDALLSAAGCSLVGGTLLFRLAQHPDAAHLADRLGRHGILVRTFDYEPTWLRFGLPGTEAQWERLAHVLGTAPSR